jgi:Txe/YoeB family toxin of toxin-antitoxin system
MYRVVFSKMAQKDAKKLAASHLKPQAEKLIAVLKMDPYQTPPPNEKLTGNLKGSFSRRINIQHRLVYEIYEEEQTVLVLRMWSHYE